MVINQVSMRAFSVGVVLLLSIACRAYTPTPVQTLEPKTIVRISLNDSGRSAVSTQVGPQIDYLEGTVISKDSTRVTLSATVIKRLTTPHEKYGTPRQVIIPVSGIGSASTFHVSKGRTWLLSGAVATGALLIGNAISGGELFGGGGTRGTNNEK
jgi:hypothetical protein